MVAMTVAVDWVPLSKGLGRGGVEDGNHANLLRLTGGVYRRLVERQAKGLGDDLAA